MEKINLITPEDRTTFDRIDRDCLKMHVCPPPKTFINMKVHDANGNLTLDMDIPSRSWVRNAYNVMCAGMLDLTQNAGGTTFGEGKMCIARDTGAVLSTSAYVARVGESAVYPNDAGVPGYGICVGTGDDAESIESYALAAIISHGSASGEMIYNAQIKSGGSYDAETKKWSNTISRVFNNNSGGEITVKEVGLSAKILYSSGTSSSGILMSRDLLPTPVTVTNAAQLTVTYTIEMTFPA